RSSAKRTAPPRRGAGTRTSRTCEHHRALGARLRGTRLGTCPAQPTRARLEDSAMSRTTPDYDEGFVTEDRTTARSWDASIVFRLIAVIAAAVMTTIGLIAVARTSWGDGFDAAPVDVAG